MVSATHIYKVKGERLKVWCAEREINYLESCDNRESRESRESREIFVIPDLAVVSSSLRLFVFSSLSSQNKQIKTHLPKYHNPISCQKGLDLALTRKLADGTY